MGITGVETPSNLLNILKNVTHRGESLYQRYINVINDYKLGLYDKLGVDAGKFVEEFVVIVAEKEGISCELINVRKAINKIKDELHNRKEPLAKEKSVMLEIAYYSVYKLRNIRDAAHANKRKISVWDALHIIESSTWLLEEYLNLYADLTEEEIKKVFFPFTIPYEALKVVENIDGKLVPLYDMNGKELILFALFSNSEKCLSPRSIVNMIDKIKPGSVYAYLATLARRGFVVKLRKGSKTCYKITSKGKIFIFRKLYEYNNKSGGVINND